jgi:hypothetical protein
VAVVNTVVVEEEKVVVVVAGKMVYSTFLPLMED